MKRSYAIILGLVLLAILGLGAYLVSTKSYSVKSAPEPTEEVKSQSLTMLFVGDIMLDRGVRNAISREGASYLFEGVRSIFSGADLIVGNLEGTFTNEPSVSADGTLLKFTFDPALVSMLKEFEFDGFSLANNHALDFGRAGYDSTQTFLDEAGLFHFGSPLNDVNLSARVALEGERVCFVGYHQLFDADTFSVIQELNALGGDCGYTVVFAHWGDEYESEENAEQRRIGRMFVDAGVDLVVGHHPHVVQPVEVYKDKAIFYSLGNFLFDQDFSLATRQGLAVHLKLTKGEQKFELIPIEMSRARVYLLQEEPVNSATTTTHFILPR